MSEPPPGTGATGRPEPSRQNSGVSAGMVFLGIFAFVVADFVLFVTTGTGNGRVVLALAAVALAGGGALCLVRSRSRGARGFGLGLMIGWALVSVVSGGICTGFNTA